jgi:hypothetical protein
MKGPVFKPALTLFQAGERAFRGIIRLKLGTNSSGFNGIRRIFWGIFEGF